jgi:hypothetical protein
MDAQKQVPLGWAQFTATMKLFFRRRMYSESGYFSALHILS